MGLSEPLCSSKGPMWGQCCDGQAGQATTVTGSKPSREPLIGAVVGGHSGQLNTCLWRTDDLMGPLGPLWRQRDLERRGWGALRTSAGPPSLHQLLAPPPSSNLLKIAFLPCGTRTSKGPHPSRNLSQSVKEMIKNRVIEALWCINSFNLQNNPTS